VLSGLSFNEATFLLISRQEPLEGSKYALGEVPQRRLLSLISTQLNEKLIDKCIYETLGSRD